MQSRIRMRTVVGVVATAWLWLPMADGCHKHSKAVAAEQDQKAEKVKAYPLDKCVVSDEKLGSMGKPYVFTNNTQEVKLCCKDCLKEFKKEPAKYTKKIEAAQPKK